MNREISLISLMKSNEGILIIFCILLVIDVIGKWTVFEKIGCKAWKSLIPIYSEYILWKLVGKSGSYIIILLSNVLFFIGRFVLIFLVLAAGSLFILLIFFLLLGLIIYIPVSRYDFCNKLSKSFGHGFLFTWGLFVMEPIFLIILGFNEDEYQK